MHKWKEGIRYFNGACWEELEALISSTPMQPLETLQTTAEHPFIVNIGFIRILMKSSKCNEIPAFIFPHSFNTGLFKTRINNLIQTALSKSSSQRYPTDGRANERWPLIYGANVMLIERRLRYHVAKPGDIIRFQMNPGLEPTRRKHCDSLPNQIITYGKVPNTWHLEEKQKPHWLLNFTLMTKMNNFVQWKNNAFPKAVK